MRYEELEKTLGIYKLDLDSFADAIGLKARSISTNYKNKPKDLPKYYDRFLDLYIQLQNEKVKNVLVEEKLSFDNDLINCDKVLDEKAQKIAQKKCIENNISISDYLSSLIISNL
ncbi:MAG TPA: hypothetical protein VLZ29_08490 [Sulfurimonas sp.]|uniref:hypothetical protein n=1 Tax=Sulfurimonas sp. TaxID=2022749 RepID=UPI002C827645|nr:hypothetical protein [Sulfurimonas sp.]HUH43142.1 hypothetical protein [Sulfurimonas sp.]